ncbi:restriction endonuclease subunit S [Pseudoalteromonas fuliginea]|uniref:restriction endonuclease subunit S n=1 Tax=Pseudoalteromonas fuliginea TaxID=1872678 RepID=UPI00316D910C
MGSDWIDCELGDLIELKRGYDLPKTKRVNGGVPVVSSSGSSGEHNEIKVKAPGVVTGRYGTIGEVFYIEDDFWPLNTTLYVKDFKGNDPLYVYYFLKTIRYSDYTDKGAVPGINRNHIHRAKVKVPVDPLHQRNLALKLFDLDKKIQLNKQTNQTLEKMAQALFKSWFVDFDPVFDNLLASADFKLENLETSLPDELIQKAQRRLTALNSLHNATQCKASLSALAHELQAQLPTKEATQAAEKGTETPVKANFNANPTILAQHANTHAHFPNEFEHNEQLGWIPKGWSADNLSIIAKFTSERVNGDDLTFDNYISTDNMRANRGGITKASKIPEVKTTPGFRPGHILISNIRPYFKKIWLATSSGGRSNDVLGFEALEPKNTGYLFNLLFQDAFFDYMMTTSKGSKMPRGDKKAIMDWMIVIPPDHIQENYSMLVKEFYKATSLRSKEIDTLTELRDTLLPKLISGELQIPDTATVEEIVD